MAAILFRTEVNIASYEQPIKLHVKQYMIHLWLIILLCKRKTKIRAQLNSQISYYRHNNNNNNNIIITSYSYNNNINNDNNINNLK